VFVSWSVYLLTVTLCLILPEYLQIRNVVAVLDYLQRSRPYLARVKAGTSFNFALNLYGLKLSLWSN
jgi:hypothetical protein